MEDLIVYYIILYYILRGYVVDGGPDCILPYPRGLTPRAF